MTDDRYSDLDALISVDWSSDRQVSDVELRRSRAHVERLIADPAYSAPPARKRPALRRPVLAFAAAAVVAVTVAVSISVAAPGQRAFASWTAVPTEQGVNQALGQARECAATWLGDVPHGGLTAEDVLLAETRGDASLTVVRKGDHPVVCLRVTSTSPILWGDLRGSDTAATLAPTKVASNGFTMSSDSGHRFTYTAGQAGADVSSVEVITQDGTKITASLSNGYWAAWWPGEVTEPDDVRIVVHSTDGTTSYSPRDIQD
jgi:hypothetical protein